MTDAESTQNSDNEQSVRKQHHVSNALGDALEEAEESSSKTIKSMIFLDIVLAIGLLLTVGAFALGLFKMYIMHSAEQSITQQNYKAAIAILRDNPVPALFNASGSDSKELLNQALYLDAMDKLEGDNDVDGALKELEKIEAGSRYFALAQEIITEYYVPSPTLLQGGTEHLEMNPEKQNNTRSLKDELDSN